MAALSEQGLNAHYATGSRAFTETLRNVIGSRGGIQCKYFNGYRNAQVNDVDVLICDEAHRLRARSDTRFTPNTSRSSRSQIQELIGAAKTGIFFIDDRQVVRPNEIGSSSYIRESARESGCLVLEYQLEAQFRCAGSEAFVSWIDNTLDIARTAHTIWEGSEGYDFRIVPSVAALDGLIRQSVASGQSARLVAGFCWPWSDPTPDGRLLEDVEIGAFRRAWNARPEARKLALGIPKATLWAHDPRGIDQIGCIYTAQGFEFDHVGVIFGRDLVYDLDGQRWVGQPEQSRDRSVRRAGASFEALVKNVYRVLLSRGLKGCYVHFLDKGTERFFKTRMGTPPKAAELRVAEPRPHPDRER